MIIKSMDNNEINLNLYTRQDNNDTPAVQHYITMYAWPLCKILLQKHASCVYCQAGQIVTISQTNSFWLALWT